MARLGIIIAKKRQIICSRTSTTPRSRRRIPRTTRSGGHPHLLVTKVVTSPQRVRLPPTFTCELTDRQHPPHRCLKRLSMNSTQFNSIHFISIHTPNCILLPSTCSFTPLISESITRHLQLMHNTAHHARRPLMQPQAPAMISIRIPYLLSITLIE